MRRDPTRVASALLLVATLALSSAAHGQDFDPGEGDPHAGQAGTGAPEGPPPDGAAEDPSIPHGSIVVALLDPAGKPVPRTEVSCGVLVSSVAQGDRRSKVTATTDDEGLARFDKLETGLGVAYRISVMREGASFAAPPFNMPPNAGMRAKLHIYPVTRDVEQALVVSQGMIFAEVKDDRVQVQQAFRVYNFGKTAWVPDDLVLALPPDFTGFAAQQGMNDITAVAVPKQGVAIRGTFAPGQHVVEFRWQKPYGGEADVRIDAGLFPHVAAMQVVAPAARQMTLEVPGFPPPRPQTDGQGQRMLATERQLRREDPPMKTVTLTVGGLPTEGPGKLVATLVATCAVAMGLVLGTRKPTRRSGDLDAERKRLLEALAALDEALREGSVGPKTYERGRRELLDELARTFVTDASAVVSAPAEGARPPKKKRSAPV